MLDVIFLKNVISRQRHMSTELTCNDCDMILRVFLYTMTLEITSCSCLPLYKPLVSLTMAGFSFYNASCLCMFVSWALLPNLKLLAVCSAT